MAKPKLIVFASGSKTGGGSGFEKLVEAHHSGGVLNAEIVAVVSNYAEGGVFTRARRLWIPFEYFPKPWTGARYEAIIKKYDAKYVALSGWLKLAVVRRRLGLGGAILRFFGFDCGLDPRYTFNIHPALLSQLSGRFGGPGMYGHHVHEAVKLALDAGEITESGFTMHFVTAEYDRGPVFAEVRVSLRPGMTADEIGKAVNALEHKRQPVITNMVVQGEISWDGKDPQSLVVPGDLRKRLSMI